MTAEATVTDGSAHPVSAHTGTILAHPSNVYVGINAKRWGAAAKQPTPIHFITVHPDSTTAAKQVIAVKIASVTWVYGHNVYYDNDGWKQQIDVIHTSTLTTGSDGTAVEDFTPSKPGAYRVEAVTKDAQGRVASATMRIYVTEKEYRDDIYWQPPQSAMTPTADKISYKPGDTALIDVPTGFVESSVMLVTVERGSVLWSDVVKLDTPSLTYKLSILDKFAPGVTVNFTVYSAGKPDYRYGDVKIKVEPVTKRLNIQLTPSTTTSTPRGTVSFDVLVTDNQHKPVQADVSLALVDKSVLALVEPNTPTLEGFYYDSASVQNYVQTTLSEFSYIPLLQSSYIVPCCFGGGGGGPGGPQPLSAYIRSNFKYTALWSPFVTTDADGKASVQVTLPDNTTTWTLDARAVTTTTQVGQGTTELLATLPLLIRPVVPRFFIAGDTVQLSAIVNNNTGKDQTATVKLDAAGVTLNSSATQQVHIAKGQQLRVVWPAKVNDAVHADLTFTVIGSDGISDASKPTLSITGDGTIPIYQYVAYDNVATSGALLQPGVQANKITIPPHYTNVSGQVTVGLESSLARVSLDSLNYLQAYPHDCNEQTVSKFLPNAATLNALKALNISKPELEQQLTQQINAAQMKLQQAKNDDGGWGWFPRMETDPLVTAYAILGNKISGYQEIANGQSPISQLEQEVIVPDVNTSAWMLDRQAFYWYVLAYAYQSAQNGYSDYDRNHAIYYLRSLYPYRTKMDYAARAFLLMAYQYTDPRAEAVTQLRDDLLSAVHRSGTMAFWKESSEDRWNWGTDTRTTALAIKAILQVKPNDPILPLAVRWLVNVRQYDHWETTQETAWSVMALTDWMVSTHELNGNFGYAVKLGDTSLLTGTVKAGDIRDINKLQIDVQKFISARADLLNIERGDGEGALYYTTNLQLYSSASQARAIDRGVSIKRQYFGSNGPITQAKVGDVITVRLTFTVEEDMHYFVLEDPYPAGIEAVNTVFRTTSLAAEEPTLNQIWNDKEYAGWGWWYIDRVELRDQQMNLYADYLPQGTYTFTYQVKATFPGVFQVMPAHAYPFYQLDQFGRSVGATLTISNESF